MMATQMATAIPKRRARLLSCLVLLLSMPLLQSPGHANVMASQAAGNEAVLAGAMPKVFAATRYWNAAHPQPPGHNAQHPDFSGVWQLERSENLSGFMQAIGYNVLLAKAAGLARVKQTIEQKVTELHFVFEVNPPLLSPRREFVVPIGAPEVLMSDDAGRDMLLLNPVWQGDIFSAGLRYVNPKHDLTIDRYMEDGRMVEHVRYPERGIEMRRIFRKGC
ncbi:unnamed protein product [Symbiodinium natans]|uniref:Uncharacterized protein n=1 Tax=Symbiodinium natans TaxID=878477 RepID=A0A812KYT6_9DINO|nr:unnamed protein product [Symbiodinium natans]